MTYVSMEMTFFKKKWKEARWPLPQGENRGHRREKNKINKKKNTQSKVGNIQQSMADSE